MLYKLWGCSDLYGTKRGHRYQQGEFRDRFPTPLTHQLFIHPVLIRRWNGYNPPKEGYNPGRLNVWTYSSVKILTWNQRMPHLGEREKHLHNPSIWRFQPLNFCGVYSMAKVTSQFPARLISQWQWGDAGPNGRKMGALVNGCFWFPQ